MGVSASSARETGRGDAEFERENDPDVEGGRGKTAAEGKRMGGDVKGTGEGGE